MEQAAIALIVVLALIPLTRSTIEILVFFWEAIKKEVMKKGNIKEYFSALIALQVKVMKTSLEAIGGLMMLLLLTFIVYAIMAFILMETNPVYWTQGARAITAIIGFILWISGIRFMAKELNKNGNKEKHEQENRTT